MSPTNYTYLSQTAIKAKTQYSINFALFETTIWIESFYYKLYEKNKTLNIVSLQSN